MFNFLYSVYLFFCVLRGLGLVGSMHAHSGLQALNPKAHSACMLPTSLKPQSTLKHACTLILVI